MGTGCGGADGATQRPMGEQSGKQVAFFFRRQPPVRASLAEDGEDQRRHSVVHLLGVAPPFHESHGQLRGLTLIDLQHLAQRATQQGRRPVIHEQTDESRQCRKHIVEQPSTFGVKPLDRVVRVPQITSRCHWPCGNIAWPIAQDSRTRIQGTG